MSNILVVGGYGGFGAKVSQLLAEDDHHIFIAGRSLAKAQEFCARFPNRNLYPAVLDRDHIDPAKLTELKIDILIDASGPFQEQDYDVAKACIAASTHYLDLSDGRAFVNNIAQLDGEAGSAGVCLISGASSLPALSTAVVDTLVEDMDHISLLTAALSASNRLSGSPSVTQAILSYAGKALRIWRGGQWQDAAGWQETRRVRYSIDGLKDHVRSVRLCDVPDLDIFPARYVGRPATEFRAGSDIGLQDFLLWLLTWPVKWEWIRNIAGLAPLALLVQKFLALFGGGRSTMEIQAFGRENCDNVERVWTIIADDGDGMWIPAFAAPLLVNKILANKIGSGAQTAAGLLTLADFQPLFDRFAITTSIDEEKASDYLYRRIMGADFDKLPPSVQHNHMIHADLGMTGIADIERGTNPISRLIAAIFRFPAAGKDIPVDVNMREQNGAETWTRNFGGHRFKSRLSQKDSMVVERFGPFRFAMELCSGARGLTMHMRKAWFLVLPFPLALAPRIRAEEYEADGKFHFDVDIALPIIGRIVHYRGFLEPLERIDQVETTSDFGNDSLTIKPPKSSLSSRFTPPS